MISIDQVCFKSYACTYKVYVYEWLTKYKINVFKKEKVLLCLLYFVVKFIYDSNKQSAKAKHDVIVYDKKKETVSMATINIIFLEQKKALNYLRETKVSQLRWLL